MEFITEYFNDSYLTDEAIRERLTQLNDSEMRWRRKRSFANPWPLRSCNLIYPACLTSHYYSMYGVRCRHNADVEKGMEQTQVVRLNNLQANLYRITAKQAKLLSNKWRNIQRYSPGQLLHLFRYHSFLISIGLRSFIKGGSRHRGLRELEYNQL